MTIKKIIAALTTTIVFSTSHLFADTLNDYDKVSKQSAQFIGLIESGKAADAYDLLSRYVTASNAEFESIKSKALSNIEMINVELGKPLGSALLKREVVSTHFERYSYLVKYKKAAIVWQITWYQPQDGWQVIAVNFSANIDPFYVQKDL